jgi:hypothetical protein
LIALMDEFTNNFAYIGRRTTGTKAGSFLVARPSWKGQPWNEVTITPSESCCGS